MAKGTAKPTAGTGASSALVGTIKRGKGLQVTYAGFPLYTYVGDAKAGQVKGEGTDKTWYVVSTKGALVKKAVATTNATTTTPTTSWPRSVGSPSASHTTARSSPPTPRQPPTQPGLRSDARASFEQ